MKKLTLFLLFGLLQAQELPNAFSFLKEVIPNIELEMRYYTNNNFIGKPIDGYLTPRAILTKKATKALKNVQKDLNEFGLGVKVFDAYRPQKAVDHFVRWSKSLNDKTMKKEYYPNVHKKNLFKEGYIAEKSGHSRGSTVDLTLIDLKTKVELDMGSSFDLFGQQSWVKYPKIDAHQRANRMLLNSIMIKHGFKSYAQEWWHFTLKNEPYKNSYFNFDI